MAVANRRLGRNWGIADGNWGKFRVRSCKLLILREFRDGIVRAFHPERLDT